MVVKVDINIVVMRFIATNLKLIGHHFVSFDTKKPYQNFPNISETAAQLTSENSWNLDSRTPERIMAPTHEEETVEAVFVDGMRGNVEPGLEFFSSAVAAIY